MKAISIQQPWAWAILHAGKDVENRNWTTHYRGELAIHAPAKQQPVRRLPRGVAHPPPNALLVNAIVGVIDLVDVVQRSSSKWFHGPFGFVLANPRPLPRPVPCKGNLMLWSVPAKVAAIVQRQVQASRVLTVTQGNLNHHHLYLKKALDLFPTDALGGANKKLAGKPVSVRWGAEQVDTDIVGRRHIFRRRGWLRKFFADYGIAAGDQLFLEQLAPYEYRLSKVR